MRAAPPSEPPTSAAPPWPQVPACYGWLSLDRRGQWRLQQERITHAGLIHFLNQHYCALEDGCWVVHNGPQRVYVELGYTPWIFRSAADGFLSHTGHPAGSVKSVWIDEIGNILLETELGVGLLDDRDLPGFIEACAPNDEDSLGLLLNHQAHSVRWKNHPIGLIRTSDVPKQFAFNPRPQG